MFAHIDAHPADTAARLALTDAIVESGVCLDVAAAESLIDGRPNGAAAATLNGVAVVATLGLHRDGGMPLTAHAAGVSVGLGLITDLDPRPGDAPGDVRLAGVWTPDGGRDGLARLAEAAGLDGGDDTLRSLAAAKMELARRAFSARPHPQYGALTPLYAAALTGAEAARG